MQSRKYIGEKSPGSLSPLLRLVGRHVHDACSVRPPTHAASMTGQRDARSRGTLALGPARKNIHI